MPPLTLENAGALVSGVTPAAIESERKTMQANNKPQLPTSLDVEVLRSFMNHERKVLKVGERATLPRVFALEMKAANKVRVIEAAPAAAAPVEPAKKPEKKGER